MEFNVDAMAVIEKLRARLSNAVLESSQYEAALEAAHARVAELEAEVALLREGGK